MSANWNAEQLVQLSNCLSDAFSLGATDRPTTDPISEKSDPAKFIHPGSTRQQPVWSIKSLNALVRMGLLKLHGWLNRWFRNLAAKKSRPNQNPQDGWTTETLIQMSQARANAFFVDGDFVAGETRSSSGDIDKPQVTPTRLIDPTRQEWESV